MSIVTKSLSSSHLNLFRIRIIRNLSKKCYIPSPIRYMVLLLRLSCSALKLFINLLLFFLSYLHQNYDDLFYSVLTANLLVTCIHSFISPFPLFCSRHRLVFTLILVSRTTNPMSLKVCCVLWFNCSFNCTLCLDI